MRDVMTNSTDPDAYKEFYGLWIETYEKAFEDFFEFMPVMEPMRKVTEPLRKAARVQADIYSNFTKMWMEGMGGQKRTA
jgi:hypothetical protein